MVVDHRTSAALLYGIGRSGAGYVECLCRQGALLIWSITAAIQHNGGRDEGYARYADGIIGHLDRLNSAGRVTTANYLGAVM
jgi:hypothetical protein